MSVLGSLGVAGISIAGNVIQNAQQSRNDAAARAWQEKMYHESNAYNSPSAMMARFKQAGLNPNLVAGQPAPSAAMVPSASQGSKAANFDDIAPNVINAKAQSEQLAMQRESLDNQKSATNANNAWQESDAKLKDEQARALSLENDAKEGKTSTPVSSSFVDGEPVVNPDGSISLPEFKVVEHNPNWYESKVKAEKLRFNNAGQEISDINALNQNRIKLSNEAVKDAQERAKYRAQYIQQEVEAGRLSNELAKQQLVAILPDVVKGLIAKNYMTYDKDGNPVLLNSDYHTIKKEIMDWIGVGTDVANTIVNLIGRIKGMKRGVPSVGGWDSDTWNPDSYPGYGID